MAPASPRCAYCAAWRAADWSRPPGPSLPDRPCRTVNTNAHRSEPIAQSQSPTDMIVRMSPIFGTFPSTGGRAAGVRIDVRGGIQFLSRPSAVENLTCLPSCTVVKGPRGRLIAPDGEHCRNVMPRPAWDNRQHGRLRPRDCPTRTLTATNLQVPAGDLPLVGILRAFGPH